MSIYNNDNQEKTFSIRAKSPEEVGTLLKDENLKTLENGKEKVFQLNAYEKREIDVFFEGEYGGSNLKRTDYCQVRLKLYIQIQNELNNMCASSKSENLGVLLYTIESDVIIFES